MNEIMTFVNEEFGSVRSTVINGEPWFVGKDIAKILGYRDTSDALKKHVEAEDKLSRYFADSGQNRLMYTHFEELHRERVSAAASTIGGKDADVEL